MKQTIRRVRNPENPGEVRESATHIDADYERARALRYARDTKRWAYCSLAASVAAVTISALALLT